MPVTLPPISRRRFLAVSLAAGTGLLLHRRGLAQTKPSIDSNRIVLLSDVHINAKPSFVVNETNMADNLTLAVKAIAALDPLPAAVIINGDCAHLTGSEADYATLVSILEPIRLAGIPVHLSMGNHDHRANLWKAIPSADTKDKPVPDRQIARLEFPLADWYLLDTLTQTNKTPGLLGDEQIAWLTKNLDAAPTKPAVVMTHHHPQSAVPKSPGIGDTQQLLDAIGPRKQVKALLFGHTHAWMSKQQDDGIHWLNLPPTAYTFTKGKPQGWVDVWMANRGANLQLNCFNVEHELHHTKVEMDWRV